MYNINSGCPRLEELKYYIYENNIDIILLNEIKIDQHKSNYFLNIEGYFTIDKPRSNHGGGVAILIKKEITYHQIHDFDFLDLEILGIKVTSKKGDFLIITYYNPNELSPLFFSKLSQLNIPFILGGDLNACSTAFGCTYNNKSGATLEQILTDFNYVLLNNHVPTRKNNILDLFICSPDIASEFDDFLVDDTCGLDSDHHPILINYFTETFFTQCPIHPTLDFHRADWDKFKSNLVSECSSVNVSLDIHSLNNQITSLILKAADQSIPYSTKKKFKFSLPKNIIDLIKLKRKNRRKYKQTHNINLKNEYNNLNTKIKQEIRDHRNKKWEEFLEKLGPNPTSSKPFWQRINKFRTRNFGKIPTIVLNNKKITTDTEKANAFSDSLAQTFCLDMSSAFDVVFEKEVIDFLSQVNANADRNNIIFPEFTLKEIQSSILKLKTDSAKGFDGIHNKLLKNLPLPFIKIILLLFNKCMKEKKMPQTWKIAKITMIPKKDQNKTLLSSYRPISVTSCLGKLFERVVAQRMYSFLESKNILTKYQSGFRAHRCTLDNLLFFTQKTAEAFNRKKNIVAIFF